MIDFRRQQFVLARLADYCAYGARTRGIRDPALYMREKLRELDGPLQGLKDDILAEHSSAFFWKLRRGQLGGEDAAEFKQLLYTYLSAGDFADAMYQLHELLSDPDSEERFKTAAEFFKNLRSCRLLDEEEKPPERRNKEWTRLVTDIMHRFDFDLLEEVAARKARSERRLRFILHRLRRRTGEYCTVLHFPKHENDMLTPFIIPRVEALVAANLRVLRHLRSPA